MHRRFRVSNFQSITRVRPFCTSMPIGLSGGWNQIQFNLCDFTRRAYGTNYIETTRMQIHANCRIRRIYFADSLYSEDEMPEDFKLFFPVPRKKCVREEDVPKKPSLIPEKIPSIVKEEPIIEEVLEEILEPSLITKEPDLIEETIPEMYPEEIEKIIMEDEEEKEEEEEEEEEEGEEEEEEEEGEVEEIVIFEEEAEPTNVIRKDKDEEETVDTSKLEEDYTEDEAD